MDACAWTLISCELVLPWHNMCEGFILLWRVLTCVSRNVLIGVLAVSVASIFDCAMMICKWMILKLISCMLNIADEWWLPIHSSQKPPPRLRDQTTNHGRAHLYMPHDSWAWLLCFVFSEFLSCLEIKILSNGHVEDQATAESILVDVVIVASRRFEEGTILKRVEHCHAEISGCFLLKRDGLSSIDKAFNTKGI